MVSVSFQQNGQELARLDVQAGMPPQVHGDGSWLDFSFEPVSPRLGRPVSFAEDNEEWARSLAQAYAGTALEAVVVRDEPTEQPQQLTTMPAPPAAVRAPAQQTAFAPADDTSAFALANTEPAGLDAPQRPPAATEPDRPVVQPTAGFDADHSGFGAFDGQELALSTPPAFDSDGRPRPPVRKAAFALAAAAALMAGVVFALSRAGVLVKVTDAGTLGVAALAGALMVVGALVCQRACVSLGCAQPRLSLVLFSAGAGGLAAALAILALPGPAGWAAGAAAGLVVAAWMLARSEFTEQPERALALVLIAAACLLGGAQVHSVLSAHDSAPAGGPVAPAQPDPAPPAS